MKIAITGGTGFVGKALAGLIVTQGHEPVILSRLTGGAVADSAAMDKALSGCDAVVHCAGINREIGDQTYQNVHVQGTRNVVEAAKSNGVSRVVLVSFLRARPDCGSAYHESKFEAEEIVRASGLPYVILKPGVIYGHGDHMLDHLKRAFHTFPVFGFVGMRDKNVAPLHVDDLAKILTAAATGELNGTYAVVGPEVLPLRTAVRRVARVTGRKPLFVPLPIWFHRLFARLAEWTMRVPVVSLAQIRILADGVAEPTGNVKALPDHFSPRRTFSEDAIREGLPQAGRYGCRDLRCCLKGV